jgi:branched-chain amino acid transport system substrate-binding protein
MNPTSFLNSTSPVSQPAQTLRRVGLALGLASAMTAAWSFEAPDDGVYKDRIDWGVMMDLSGPTAANEVPWTNGVKAYIRKVNEEGGIHGRKINLLVEDDRYETSLVRVNYERLVTQTKVLAISGMGSSSAQASLMPQIKRGPVPIVGAYALNKLGYEPANPMYYAGFCGTKEMAQAGVGYFSERLKLKNPKVAVVHLDVAGGKEFADYIGVEVAKVNGSHKAFPVKTGAADVTAQVLEISTMKPDLVAIYGVPNNSILTMRALLQYGLKIPAFGITHLGTPEIYTAIGPEAAANYYFMSCFSPGESEDTAGLREMSAAADKYGYGNQKSNVNYVGGWVIGQLIAESLRSVGTEPTRAKLVAMLNAGFQIDTKGVSSPLKYTKDDHRGLVNLRAYTFDFQSKKFKAFGQYADYEKYMK